MREDGRNGHTKKIKEAAHASDGNYAILYSNVNGDERRKKVLSFWATLVRRAAAKRKRLKRLCHVMKLGEYLRTGVEGRGRHRQTE